MQSDDSFNHQNNNELSLCRSPFLETRLPEISLKPLFSLMSCFNVLKYCFYYKPYDKFEIIISSITNSVDLNQSKYKLNDMLKSKAYLHRLLGK